MMLLRHSRSDSETAPALLDFVRSRSSRGYDFWLGGDTTIDPASIPFQDHADIVYSLVLLGSGGRLSADAADAFVAMLSEARLHGRPDGKALADKTPNAHATAYALGAVRLLEQEGLTVAGRPLYEGWRVEDLIDKASLPLWPKAWSHHIWRVSHWIGGNPSILLHLARSKHPIAGIDDRLVDRVLAASESRIIDKRNGLLRPYKSAVLQRLFRLAYRLRHDPDLGNVGGVVHLLWVNHAMKRKYVAAESLHHQAFDHMQKVPFLESMPYCLDFDIVQLVRTTKQYSADENALHARADRLSSDIADFLNGELPEAYTLHKLPGALATINECALITDRAIVPFTGHVPVDIIKRAFWI